MKLLAAVASLAVISAATPDPPSVHRFSGKPLRIPVSCTYEQVQALSLPCSESNPCPVFLELADLDQVGARIFLTGNVHTDTTTIESVLLMTVDDGKTWTEPASRVAMAGIDRIQFIDFEAGWISGQIQQTQPRDPFFLATRDGGKTWRKQPVFSDARPGAVENFHFDSRTNGTMLIDRVQPDDNGMRHILYETSTGGDSWSIREVSPKPIAWKHADSGEKELRLRTEASSKSYRLERRQGAKWELVTSFSVSAGECKPVEPQPSEANASSEPPSSPSADEKPALDRPIAPRRPPTLKK